MPGREGEYLDKKQLRKVAKEKLAGIPDDERKEINVKLVRNLTATDWWNEAVVIGVTVSGDLEWDTKPIIRQAWQEGKTVAVPKCIPETRKLDFYKLEDFNQLEESFFQLLEPIPEQTEKLEKHSIELLVVPGLLYDARGYRIGFGGGYYDRFLANFPNRSVSILHSGQWIDEIPNGPYDIPVQQLITENGVVKGR